MRVHDSQAYRKMDVTREASIVSQLSPFSSFLHSRTMEGKWMRGRKGCILSGDKGRRGGEGNGRGWRRGKAHFCRLQETTMLVTQKYVMQQAHPVADWQALSLFFIPPPPPPIQG